MYWLYFAKLLYLLLFNLRINYQNMIIVIYYLVTGFGLRAVS